MPPACTPRPAPDRPWARADRRVPCPRSTNRAQPARLSSRSLHSGPKIVLDRLVERFAANEALAQLALEQLAARILGQGIDEDDALGHLEMRHLAGAMLDDGLLVELLAALDHDNRSHRLDPARIGQAYHGNLGHGGD